MLKTYSILCWLILTTICHVFAMNCKCICDRGESVCVENMDNDCKLHCAKRCTPEDNVVHTMDNEGKCSNPDNCTCVGDYYNFEPICTKGITDGANQTRTFPTLQWLHCYTLCHGSRYKFNHTGECNQFILIPDPLLL